jgi:hypothetical protein
LKWENKKFGYELKYRFLSKWRGRRMVRLRLADAQSQPIENVLMF